MPEWPAATWAAAGAVVERLARRPALVGLFLDAQFESMPADFCLRAFRVPYPPPSVCFGEGSWERWDAYQRSGRSLVIRR